jgi:hypothetical protein
VASEYAGENLFNRVATAQDAEQICAIADLSSPHLNSYALHEMGHSELVPREDRIYVAVPVVLEKALISGDLLGRLVKLGGDGIVYDSVRHRDSAGNLLGECAAVMRPPVLRHAQVTRTVQYHWDGARIAEIR